MLLVLVNLVNSAQFEEFEVMKAAVSEAKNISYLILWTQPKSRSSRST